MAPSRPNPNVLDLRRLAVERQAEERSRRRWPGRAAGRPPQPLSLVHQPRLVRRDWGTFSRELMKFGLVLALVAALSGAVIVVTRLTSTRTTVERTASGALEELQNGLASLGQSQPAAAADHFAIAAAKFRQAQTDLARGLPAAVDRMPWLGRRLSASRRLLNDAARLAVVGQQVSAILPTDVLRQPAVTVQADGIIQGSVGVLASLLTRRTEFLGAVKEAVAVVDDLESIPARDVPASVRGRWQVWQRLLSGLVGDGANLDHLTTLLLGLLAPDQPRDYLIVFQNNDELRPTGGFPGTYLLVKFEQGMFKILDAPGTGPFALSDEVAKVNLPPQPILSVAKFWTFHDANWFLDVPTSARTMLGFYAQDRGFSPDGMIFLTPGIMEDLLGLTGPVRPARYQVDITAENFVAATEQQVEFGYDKALNNPKQFLIDLVPLMLEKLSRLNGPDALRATALTMKRANQGDLLFYSSQDDLQSAIRGLGWDGALLPVNGDYLAVVDTNLGGGKTDRVTDERVRTTVTLDGSLLRHEVAVTRTHRGQAGDKLNGFANRDFIRVYAPPAAQLVGINGATIPDAGFFLEPEASAKLTSDLLKNEGQTLVDQANGYRITNESGRKTFGAWSRIEPGQTQTVIFTYTTPAPSGGGPATWNLTWQHQPGAPLRSWQAVFNLPKGKNVRGTAPGATISNGKRTATFTSDSTISRSFSVSYR